MANMVKGGTEALEEMRERFSELGLEIDEKFLRNSEAAVDQITDLQYAIKAKLSAAVVQAARAIRLGDGDLFIAGGVEHMTRADALVIMKIGSNYDKVVTALKEGGKYDDAWLVQFATMGNKQTVTKLSEMTDHGTPYFSIVIVHGQGRRP